MTGTPQGEIIAMGGGGFTTEPDNPLLDDFVLSRAKKTPARVCFVPTASADSISYVAKFYRALSGRCVPTDLTFFNPPALPRRPRTTGDLAAFVAEQDVFYVGGGSTANLLALWRVHGLDRLLRDAWMSGAILAGISAGMNCWFEASTTDSFGPLQPLADGIGLVPGSACPHYDGESERRPQYHRALLDGFPGGYAAEDGAALHFVGSELIGAVSSRPGARAYRVEVRDGQVVEELIPTRFLGPSLDEVI